MVGRILVTAAIILYLIMWVRAVIDVFRRHDLSAAGKAAWAIAMLVIPVIGLLVYVLLRPSNAQVARRRS
jgi:phospholipase D-like protein